jgi:GNAT superfamily N-acetyltransferase
MEILTHRELKSKDELLPLMDNALGWLYNPRTYETFIKIDPRLRNSPVGFSAVDNGRLVGYVGVMDLTTRTLNGSVECAGGVYGVATSPSHLRKGISTMLMNRAHQYFREKGYRFSFLATSHTIVAYALYLKLGYTDVFERPSAYKVLKPKRAKLPREERAAKLDLDRLLQVYNKCVKDKTGLVVRDKDYLVMLTRAESLSGKDCIIDHDGYVLFKDNVGGPWSGGTWIRELVASNDKEMNRLLERLETKAKDLIFDRAAMNETLLQVYKSRGYMIQKRSHPVIMAKPLTAEASFKQTYGEKFYMTGLDSF